MKYEHPLENKMRASRFDSRAQAEASLKDDVLSPSYIFDKLIERRILALNVDGSISGMSRAARKPASASKSWGMTWPSREAVVSIFEDTPKNVLGDIKASLAARGENCGHWSVLHALRVLLAEGFIRKDDIFYIKQPARRAPDPKDIWDSVTPAQRALMVDALNTVGEDLVRVKKYLERNPESSWSSKDIDERFIKLAAHLTDQDDGTYYWEEQEIDEEDEP